MNIKTIFKGEERTVRVKKNIIISFFLKGIDAIVYLLLVPVTLGYLNSYEYGIWLTLNSILMWINSFDIGLGNGLRNKLAIAIANNELILGRKYVSTTLFMLITLVGVIIGLYSLFEPYIDWYSILGTSPKYVPNMNKIGYISFTIFSLSFIFKFIGNVYLALQLPAVNNLIAVSGHVISLIIIYILSFIVPGNLLLVAIIYTISPLIVYMFAYPITFYKLYPYLKPTYKLFKYEYLKDLFSIGVKFFILQLSSILLFAFANILISHMFGPENVTPYNIAYRYFSLLPMVMNLVIAPMWSATTDAFAKGDIDWIKSTMNGIHKLLIIAFLGLIIMIIFSEKIYKLWIGETISIPFTLSILMGIYVFIIICSLTYSNFLNGLGKLKLQTVNTCIVAILFLPICYLLGKTIGIIGIVVGMCVLNLSGLILNIIQFSKIIQDKAIGIWAE